jgi:cbb3-type cytochrome c oxidase subunit III
MRDAVVLSVFAAVCCLAFVVTKTGEPTSAATAMDAKSVYLANCSGCHGDAGSGFVRLAPSLVKNPYVTGNPKVVIQTVLTGVAGPIREHGITWDGSMPPWEGVLSHAQIADVITYIRSSWGNHATPVTSAQVAAEAMTVVTPTRAASALGSAEELYAVNCSGCHGVNGQGAVNIAPPLAQNENVTGDPQKVISAVADGSAGPITEHGVTWNGAMPPWRATLTDKGLAAVITYIRTSWGNHASAVTEQQITALR